LKGPEKCRFSIVEDIAKPMPLTVLIHHQNTIKDTVKNEIPITVKIFKDNGEVIRK